MDINTFWALFGTNAGFNLENNSRDFFQLN